MTTFKIQLGQKVRDTLSGVVGTVIARTEWLYGCLRITIQPSGEKDGVPLDAFVIDEPQAALIEDTVADPAVAPAHGPRTDPGRAPDPTRR